MRRMTVLAAAFAAALSSAGAARLDSLRVPAGADSLLAIVAIPDGPGPVPVVYLLHGFGAGPRAMLEVLDLGRAADRYRIAIVCPDGRPDSWYFDSPVDTSLRTESDLLTRVIPAVEAHFGLRPAVRRGIAGISMGGHGALWLALRNDGLFQAAASVSGVLDLTETTQPAALARRLGSFEDHARRWRTMSVLALADSLEPGGPALSIDCGLDDPFINGNRSVRARLLQRGIDHVYTERPGGHDRATFARALEQQLLFLSRALGAPE